MLLREIMNTKVVTIGPEESAAAAWTRMRRRDIRHLMVVEDGRPVGVLSERDLGGRDGGATRRGRLVRDLMTSRLESVGPDTTVSDAADLMRARLIGSLPIVDGEQLVGIVTATDIFDEVARDGTGSRDRAERELLRAPASSKRLGGRPAARGRARGDGDVPAERAGADGRDKRAPLADRVPKALKRTAGRTAAPDVPANIRVAGLRLDQDDKDRIRERLGAKLGKFAASIERVSVRVEDVNGPRGGVDQLCRIKVVLSGLPSVVVENQAASLAPAVSGALAAVERAVRRNVQRRRMRPIRQEAGRASSRR